MHNIVLGWRRNRRAAGQRLRSLREQADLTQLDPAACSGLTNDSICRIELGQRAPRAATIQLLAVALGVPVEAFVEDLPASQGGISTVC